MLTTKNWCSMNERNFNGNIWCFHFKLIFPVDYYKYWTESINRIWISWIYVMRIMYELWTNICVVIILIWKIALRDHSREKYGKRFFQLWNKVSVKNNWWNFTLSYLQLQNVYITSSSIVWLWRDLYILLTPSIMSYIIVFDKFCLFAKSCWKNGWINALKQWNAIEAITIK